MKERSTNRKDRRAISVTRSLLEARCLPDEVVGTRWFVFLGWWGRAKVGGLTTCQVLEVPGRGEQGREGGGNCDLVDCCSSTMGYIEGCSCPGDNN